MRIVKPSTGGVVNETDPVYLAAITAVDGVVVADGAGGVQKATNLDDVAYLPAAGKAADSDKLDDHDSAYFQVQDADLDAIAALAGTDGFLRKTAADTWELNKNNDIYGDGSDVDVTITGTQTCTRDMYYNNLTIATYGILVTNQFKVFVKGTLDMGSNGIIRADGIAGGNATNATGPSAGVGGAQPSAPTAGSIKAPVRGVAGSNGGAGKTSAGVGNNGVTATIGANEAASYLTGTSGNGQAGIQGASGGAADTNAGGSGGSPGSYGAATAITAANGNPPWNSVSIITWRTQGATATIFGGFAGNGSSSGGGSGGFKAAEPP